MACPSLQVGPGSSLLLPRPHPPSRMGIPSSRAPEGQGLTFLHKPSFKKSPSRMPWGRAKVSWAAPLGLVGRSWGLAEGGLQTGPLPGGGCHGNQREAAPHGCLLHKGPA